MPAKTVFSMDTEYTADSVECCPFDGYTSLTVVATYQMVDGKTQTRTGRIYLFETQTTASDTEFGVDIVTKEVARCECDAVLDSRWIMLSGEPFVLTVSSTGTLCVYNGIPEKKLNRAMTKTERGEMLLCIDHVYSSEAKNSAQLICGHSDGSVSTYRIANVDGNIRIEKQIEFKGHDYQVWCASFCHETPEVLWTGSDDSYLKIWDLRVGTEMPISKKRFDAGVTTVAFSPHDPTLVGVGSYTGEFSIGDVRTPFRPSAVCRTAGGVWRSKWHPRDRDVVLLGAMHAGVQVWRGTRRYSTVECVETYTKPHNSLAYGADWSRIELPNGRYLVGACSFYDHLFSMFVL